MSCLDCRAGHAVRILLLTTCLQPNHHHRSIRYHIRHRYASLQQLPRHLLTLCLLTATAGLEFQIPPVVPRYASFMFSFIGRGICTYYHYSIAQQPLTPHFQRPQSARSPSCIADFAFHHSLHLHRQRHPRHWQMVQNSPRNHCSHCRHRLRGAGIHPPDRTASQHARRRCELGRRADLGHRHREGLEQQATGNGALHVVSRCGGL